MLKRQKKKIIYTLDPYKKLSTTLSKIRGIEKGSFRLLRFLNGELYIKLRSPFVGNDSFILGTFMPPDNNLTELTLLAHTLLKEKASQITLFAPYLPYSRQERKEIHMSMNTEWAARLLVASGIDRIVTVDMHTKLLKKIYTIPLISLNPAVLFASEIKKLKLMNISLVAPDEGALGRITAVRKQLSKKVTLAYLKKERTNRIKHTALVGTVCENAVIIDDILDTGSTLISCIQMLRFAGVKRIWVMVTHGLFTGDTWKILLKYDIEMIYVTDTISNVPTHKYIRQLSVAPLYKAYLMKKKKDT